MAFGLLLLLLLLPERPLLRLCLLLLLPLSRLEDDRSRDYVSRTITIHSTWPF